MQINEAKFLQNGKCGYVLKPSYMRKTSDYNPSYSTMSDEDPVSLVIKVETISNILILLYEFVINEEILDHCCSSFDDTSLEIQTRNC